MLSSLQPSLAKRTEQARQDAAVDGAPYGKYNNRFINWDYDAHRKAVLDARTHKKVRPSALHVRDVGASEFNKLYELPKLRSVTAVGTGDTIRLAHGFRTANARRWKAETKWRESADMRAEAVDSMAMMDTAASEEEAHRLGVEMLEAIRGRGDHAANAAKEARRKELKLMLPGKAGVAGMVKADDAVFVDEGAGIESIASAAAKKNDVEDRVSAKVKLKELAEQKAAKRKALASLRAGEGEEGEEADDTPKRTRVMPCAHCGTGVPPDVDACPSCQTVFETAFVGPRLYKEIGTLFNSGVCGMHQRNDAREAAAAEQLAKMGKPEAARLAMKEKALALQTAARLKMCRDEGGESDDDNIEEEKELYEFDLMSLSMDDLYSTLDDKAAGKTERSRLTKVDHAIDVSVAGMGLDHLAARRLSTADLPHKFRQQLRNVALRELEDEQALEQARRQRYAEQEARELGMVSKKEQRVAAAAVKAAHREEQHARKLQALEAPLAVNLPSVASLAAVSEQYAAEQLEKKETQRRRGLLSRVFHRALHAGRSSTAPPAPLPFAVHKNAREYVHVRAEPMTGAEKRAMAQRAKRHAKGELTPRGSDIEAEDDAAAGAAVTTDHPGDERLQQATILQRRLSKAWRERQEGRKILGSTRLRKGADVAIAGISRAMSSGRAAATLVARLPAHAVEQFHLAAEPLATSYADVVLGRRGPLELIGLRSVPVEFEGFEPEDMFKAVEQGNVRKLCLILAAGMPRAVRDYDGKTPLHLAAQRSDGPIACLLLAHRLGERGHRTEIVNAVDDDKFRSWTPLHEAAAVGNAAMVKLLLSRGAKVDARTASGETALMLAAGSCTSDDLTLMSDLEDYSVSAAALEAELAAAEEMGSTAASAAQGESKDKPDTRSGHDARGMKGQHIVVMKVLLSAVGRAHLELTDATGKRAMHHAAKRGHSAACKLLLRVGASTEGRDREGRKAADYAESGGRSVLADLLRVCSRQIDPAEVLKFHEQST